MKRGLLVALGSVLAVGTGVAVAVGLSRRSRPEMRTVATPLPRQAPADRFHEVAAMGREPAPVPAAGSDVRGTPPASGSRPDLSYEAPLTPLPADAYGTPVAVTPPADDRPPVTDEMTRVDESPYDNVRVGGQEDGDEEAAGELDLASLRVGDRVTDALGREVGAIRAVHGGYFELDVPGDADFWLSTAHVAGSAGASLRLDIAEADFERHRLHAPGLEPDAEPMDRPDDAVISNEQALAQRERMERELIEQRGVIDTDVRTPLPAQRPPEAKAS